MHKRVVAVVLAALAAVAIVATPVLRATAQSPFGDADAEPVPFGPHMGALMSMIIQPRHAKLGLAGKAQNWELAAYSLKELRQGFAVVAKAVPRWEGQPIPDLFDSAVSQPITLIDFAIKLRFQKQFDEAYESLTKGCNACHGTTGHAFVVIKVPEVSSFPNQEFQLKQ
jgi:cytochrome c553